MGTPASVASSHPPAPAVAVAVAVWLALCCALVFGMVVLGGAVRLTGSGLSMVDWQPLGGIIPPLDGAQWRRAFEQYRQFPEFNLVNPGMTLSGFKFIFWMEYAHRLLGRITGAVFLLPFLFFLASGRVRGAFAGRLWGLFFLGAAQGLLGWYMVKSGLADNPQVSHYRLAAHFMLAVFIYAYMLRLLVGVAARLPADENIPQRSIITTGTMALALILIAMLSGALVAGTHAGQIYNTWPKMGELWIPAQLLALQPWWLNPVENIIAIQFMHRWLAALVLIAVSVFAHQMIRAGKPRAMGGYVILALVIAQVTLGIATLLLRVPPALGVAHQAGAMLLLTATVIALAGQWPALTDQPTGKHHE